MDKTLADISESAATLVEMAARISANTTDLEQRERDLQRLADKAADQAALAALATKEEADKKRRDQERSRRRKWTAAVAVLLAVGLVGTGVTSNHRAIGQVRLEVRECFLRPGTLKPEQAAACDRSFSSKGGHEFRDVQRRSAEATKSFTALLQDVPRLRAEFDAYVRAHP